MSVRFNFRYLSLIHRLTEVFLILSFALVALPAPAQEGGLENLRQTGKAFARVARAVSPSVAYIQVESRPGGSMQFHSPFGERWPFDEEFFKRFFGDEFPGTPRQEIPPDEQRVIGQGSGFVFAPSEAESKDLTYIVTNNHVVANADKITVKFQDGHEFDAEIKGGDSKSDVAVIEVKENGLPALPLGDSAKLEVGEWVVAIGNPFGLSHSLTVGVVSAKGRTRVGISDYEDFIQTDAAINPGNSGGPLVNLDGEVVGINTAIFSRSGGYMGVGFAIPINLAKVIANQLIEQGEVTRGFLGIVIQPLTRELAQSFDLEEAQGILIAQVTEGSPAEKAGLRQGDVIVSFRDQPVKDVGSFRNQVSLTPPGSQEQLVVVRDGKKKTISVTIGTLTEEKIASKDTGPTQKIDELGLTVQTLTDELAEMFEVQAGQGVVITAVAPGSIAAQAGIESGMVITQVNREPVTKAEEFKELVNASRDERRLLLLVQKGDTQQYVVLRW